MVHARRALGLAAACALQLIGVANAHGHDAAATMTADMGPSHHVDHCGSSRPMIMKDMEDFPDHPTYFLHDAHAGIMLAHIGLMVLAWVIVLPIGVMFSIARSRLSLPSNLIFLVLNALAIVLSIIYRAQVPDLYPHNAHHKLGWIVTWLAVAWVLFNILRSYTRTRDRQTDYQHSQQAQDMQTYRWTAESRNSDASDIEPLAHARTNSWNTDLSDAPTEHAHADRDEEDADADDEKHGFLQNTAVDRFLTSHTLKIGTRLSSAINTLHIILERSMIPLGFFALTTGIVTYSGIAFGSAHIFNVLAHFIKGGIFFGYGLLTFGRWMGCFSDLGWAWNLKPGVEIVGRAKARCPSAEWIESFVIFFYGGSNVFLEHLGGWGKEWTAMDFEHVSITIMFFGGGLLGMLIESHRVRDFLSRNMVGAASHLQFPAQEWSTPSSYTHSLNPIPSLVILLLGIMMSNHTQHSLISGQIHRQWGLLFAGFALARSLTYVTLWLKPPRSYLPTRPPTELLASFCLVSGGAIFMASNKDTINALEEYHLDSMFVFTVMMGFTCLVMAWALFVVAVKGWASRKHIRQTPKVMPESPA